MKGTNENAEYQLKPGDQKLPTADTPRASRRGLFRTVGAAAVMKACLQPALADSGSQDSDGGENGNRAERSFQVRLNAAQAERQIPTPDHPTNGDEQRYSSRIGNFSKGLPHNGVGEVDATAYQRLLKAVSSGNPADFEQIPLGGASSW
jgi:hypothetical protein